MADGPARVLGVDPGLTRCGLGVVDGPASSPALVAVECVTSPAEEPLPDRLLALHGAVARVLRRHRPDVVALEQVLFSRNVRTAMGVGQAAGVALLAAAQAGIPAHGYTPTQIKLTVAGAGSADKQAVARMVVAQLGLAAAPGPADATDALAVALCHLARARFGEYAGEEIAGGRGWESVLDSPHLRVSGGTGAPPGGERT